jgi:lipoprotein signal peptidase
MWNGFIWELSMTQMQNIGLAFSFLEHGEFVWNNVKLITTITYIPLVVLHFSFVIYFFWKNDVVDLAEDPELIH